MQLSYHVTYFSQIMGYNLKYLEWKKPFENITTAKFEAPGTKEWDFLTVWISSKKFQIWMEKLLETKSSRSAITKDIPVELEHYKTVDYIECIL